MEILRDVRNQPLVWGNDGGRKDFTYIGFASVIYKAYVCEDAVGADFGYK